MFFLEIVKTVSLLYISIGFHGGSGGKESACNAGDLSSIPGLESSPGEGKGYPLQYSGLENSMDSVAWWGAVNGSQRVRRNWATNTFTSLFHRLIS